jgi:predicted permease
MPAWLTRWFLRTRATLSARHDRELRDELQLHLRLLEEDYTAQGIPQEIARRRAHREFGNATLIQEASHDLFAFRLLEQFFQDLRYALHEIRRSPGFTAVVVLSLAVGIGAVTAAFAVVDALMLRSLPVRDPERLVAFSTSDSPTWGTWPYASFLRWRDAPEMLADVAAASHIRAEVALPGTEPSRDVRVTLVSGNYFQVMGAGISRGRSLADSDAVAPGTGTVAVISDGFWERQFGRAPDVLAKTIDLQGVRYDVVGVARKGFTGHAVAAPTDVWIPITMHAALMPGSPDVLQDRWGTQARWLKVIGRLRDGVSIAQATAAAGLIQQRFVAEKAAALGEGNPQVARERKQTISLLAATTGFAPERGRYGRALMILSGITSLVLLVACANFTNLMLARSEARRREFAIRLAIGGGTWRLVRQAATECVVLAAAAGLLGLLVARWAADLSIKQFAFMMVPVELAIGIDGRVMAFAVACVALVVAFGLWPCMRLVRSAARSSVYQSTHPGRARTRAVAGRLTLIAQLAMCTVLLIGAGLFLRTVINLRMQDLGYDRNVLMVSLSPSQAGESKQAVPMLLESARERLRAVPSIQAVGVSGPSLLDATTYWIDQTERLTTDRGAVLPGARWTSVAVGPGFFDAIGMSFVQGHGFDDRAPSSPDDAIVVNRWLATYLFGTENAIGQRIRMNPRGPLRSIVGVVTDAKQTSPREGALGVVYLPMRDFGHVVLAVRTAGHPAAAASVVKHQLEAMGGLPIEKVRTISEVLDEAIAQERLMSAISLILSALAISIGCVGLYALMAYVVAQRTHELGIRLALGATRQKVVTMVLRDSAALVVPGLVIGVPLGVAASQPMSAQLFGVSANDPWTLAAVALLLTVVGLLATFKPARTASRIDPIALLRNE